MPENKENCLGTYSSQLGFLGQCHGLILSQAVSKGLIISDFVYLLTDGQQRP